MFMTNSNAKGGELLTKQGAGGLTGMTDRTAFVNDAFDLSDITCSGKWHLLRLYRGVKAAWIFDRWGRMSRLYQWRHLFLVKPQEECPALPGLALSQTASIKFLHVAITG